jgi:hypothetical protein
MTEADLDRHGIAAGPLEEVQHLQFYRVGAVIDEIPGRILERNILISPRITN